MSNAHPPLGALAPSQSSRDFSGRPHPYARLYRLPPPPFPLPPSPLAPPQQATRPNPKPSKTTIIHPPPPRLTFQPNRLKHRMHPTAQRSATFGDGVSHNVLQVRVDQVERSAVALGRLLRPDPLELAEGTNVIGNGRRVLDGARGYAGERSGSRPVKRHPLPGQEAGGASRKRAATHVSREERKDGLNPTTGRQAGPMAYTERTAGPAVKRDIIDLTGDTDEETPPRIVKTTATGPAPPTRSPAHKSHRVMRDTSTASSKAARGAHDTALATSSFPVSPRNYLPSIGANHPAQAREQSLSLANQLDAAASHPSSTRPGASMGEAIEIPEDEDPPDEVEEHVVSPLAEGVGAAPIESIKVLTSVVGWANLSSLPPKDRQGGGGPTVGAAVERKRAEAERRGVCGSDDADTLLAVQTPAVAAPVAVKPPLGSDDSPPPPSLRVPSATDVNPALEQEIVDTTLTRAISPTPALPAASEAPIPPSPAPAPPSDIVTLVPVSQAFKPFLEPASQLTLTEVPHPISSTTPLVAKPVLGILHDKCKIISIPSKGLGVTLSIRVQAGETILSETPFLVARVKDLEEKRSRVAKQYKRLGKPVAALFDAFNPKRRRDGGMADIERLVDIWDTNAIPLGSPNAPAATTGLFETISRINHSCAPNSVWRWDETAGQMHLIAYRDLEAGTELTASYITSVTRIRTRRRAVLLKDFGFHCLCTACSLPPASASASDRRLQRYAELRRNWRCSHRSAEYRDWADDLPAALRDLEMAERILNEERRYDAIGDLLEARYMLYVHHGEPGGAVRVAKRWLRHVEMVCGEKDAREWMQDVMRPEGLRDWEMLIDGD